MDRVTHRSAASNDRYFIYALAGAPAAIGFAMGALAGGRIGGRQRSGLALVALTAGIAAAAPFAVDYVKRRVAGPESRIGSSRRLRSIRDGSVPEDGGEFFEVGEQEDVVTY